MILSIHEISKSYNKGRTQALDRFTTTLEPGVYGLLGPNGAGKSTLMNIITDNLQPDSGVITLDDHSISKLGASYRSILGYMPQQQTLYHDMTGYRFLWYMAALKGLDKRTANDRIERLLEVVSLQKDANKKLGSYSGGMKQRILIAQALLNDPHILILDEPTAGLDPKERIRIKNFISSVAMNKIVILATHVVSDIEFIAKEVIWIKQGRLELQDTPTNIIGQMTGKVFEAIVPGDRLLDVQSQYRVSNLSYSPGGTCVRIVSDELPKGMDAHPVTPNLEDVYLYLFEPAPVIFT